MAGNELAEEEVWAGTLSSLEPNGADRRRTTASCASCHGWVERTAFLSNGQHYCLDCARHLVEYPHALQLAGTRGNDVRSLDLTEATDDLEERIRHILKERLIVPEMTRTNEPDQPV